MTTSKIAHRFFIIAPIALQSGSPHFTGWQSVFSYFSEYTVCLFLYPIYAPFQYSKPPFCFQLKRS